MNNDREGAKTVRDPRNITASRFNTRKVSVIAEFDDYLTVNPYTPDGLQVLTDQTLYVMKPWTMQRTVFDGETDADGILYNYVGNAERNASRAGVIENQLITPSYKEGDVLYVEEVSEVFVPDAEHSTRLMDTNRDGRAWAHLGD